MDVILTTTGFIVFCFNFLIFISLFFACLTITSTALFISIFSLIGTYFFSVWLFALLRLEFLAFIILLVYLGAIAVLFLFVIMLLPQERTTEANRSSFSVLIIPSLFFTFISVNIVELLRDSVYCITLSRDNFLSNIEQIGFLLYTSHSLVFIFCGFILFIAVICIIRIIR